MSDFFSICLTEKTGHLVHKLQAGKPRFLSAFYLSGGTALALQFGHRISEDLDFFTPDKIDALMLQKELAELGDITGAEPDHSSLTAYVDGVKVQLLHYPYDLLYAVLDWDGIRISTVPDIACTKLLTVSQRGSRKDFVDIYFILKQYPLDRLFALLERKYRGVNYNTVHILKSLTYFADADTEPMPRLTEQLSWDKVKREIIAAVTSYHLT